MSLDKLVNEFVDEQMVRGTYASREQIEHYTNNMKKIINNNDDVTIEEIIEKTIKDLAFLLENIRKKYDTPGYTVSINVNNISVKLYGGNINYLGEPMPENALFDITSMTKFYTQVIIYNMMKDGYFKANDKIVDLDNRFSNLGDLTVYDVTSFATKFSTDSHIENNKTIDEAKDTLYNSKVEEVGNYNYNDIGMMIMKEVCEAQSGETFEELVDKYIVKPFGLNDTHLIVPNNKYHLLTGTPVKNAKLGLVNDAKAIALGGYSGHAGIFSSSDDLIKLMRGVYTDGKLPNVGAAYTYGMNDARGIMGNTYTTHPKGVNGSYLDITEPFDSFAIQGRTKVNATGSRDSAHNILFNPSSSSAKTTELKQMKYNIESLKIGENVKKFVKKFEFNRDGQVLDVDIIDSKELLPSDDSVELVIEKNAQITIMLRFLSKLLNECGYCNEFNVVRQVKKL